MSLHEQLSLGFKESIVEAMSTIASLVPKVSEKTSDVDVVKSGNIVVSLSFAGKLEGTIFFILSEDSARNLIGKMLGCKPQEVSPDCFDGIGEIINIVAGGVKRRVEPDGYDFVISIPSVVKGDTNLSITSLGKPEKIILSVVCPGIDFEMVLFYFFNSTKGKSVYAAVKDQKASEAEKTLKDFLNKG